MLNILLCEGPNNFCGVTSNLVVSFGNKNEKRKWAVVVLLTCLQVSMGIRHVKNDDLKLRSKMWK